MIYIQYSIGNIVVELESSVPLAENEKIAVFRTAQSHADYYVHVDVTQESQKPYVQRNDNHFYVKIYQNACDMIYVEGIFNALNMPLLLLEKGVLILHASYIVWQEQAILFSAASGVGKTTQAKLWQQLKGAEIVNGDRTVIFRKGDSFFAGGIYYSGSSGDCKNITKPIRALLLLGQGKDNVLFEATPLEAFKRLLVQCAYDVGSRKETEAAVKHVAELISDVQVLHFDCIPDKSAVEMLAGYL